MCGRGVWSRLSEYEGPDEDESARLTTLLLDNTISHSEYVIRQRNLRRSVTGSLAFVLFMATILPVVDWARAAWSGFRRAVR